MSVWKQLLETAVYAPSPHNVQPGRLRILSNDTADLLIEKHRTLPKEDPTGSFIILTMGLFIEALKIVAANSSLNLNFQLCQPVSQFTPEHIAKAKGELLPFARLGVIPAADAPVNSGFENALFRTRRTSRLSFSPEPVPNEAVEVLSKIAHLGTNCRFFEVMTMTAFLSTLLLITGLQSSCCRQSFSYPVIVDVIRIEVVTDENVKLKEIKDPSTIDSIIRFIDDRRGRWCSQSFTMPATSATLNLYLAKGSTSKISLGKGFFVAEFSRRKYLLRISPDEQQALFKMLDIDQDRLCQGESQLGSPDC